MRSRRKFLIDGFLTSGACLVDSRPIERGIRRLGETGWMDSSGSPDEPDRILYYGEVAGFRLDDDNWNPPYETTGAEWLGLPLDFDVSIPGNLSRLARRMKKYEFEEKVRSCMFGDFSAEDWPYDDGGWKADLIGFLTNPIQPHNQEEFEEWWLHGENPMLSAYEYLDGLQLVNAESSSSNSIGELWSTLPYRDSCDYHMGPLIRIWSDNYLQVLSALHQRLTELDENVRIVLAE